MRIAIDVQGIQSEGSRLRGIGRYSLEIVRHIISHSNDNSFILFANGSLFDLRNQFSSELKKENVSYFEWFAPYPLDYISRNKYNLQLATYLRTFALKTLNADLILLTSYFEGFSDNCLTDLDNEWIEIPQIAIFYDLIPLLNAELYLTTNPEFERFYRYKLKGLSKLDGLLAISSSSAKEAIQYLSFDKKFVFNISSACDKNLFKLDSNSTEEESSKIDKLSPYILYSGACDPRKNIKGLLKAFSLLNQDLPQYNLVLVGKLLPAEVDLVDEFILTFKIDSKKIFKLGYVSDDELAILYRRCKLFIFPSFHEGFGLPVLEAMCCGAPVLASNRTSIPEVIGLEKAMFDPSNVQEMKELMYKGLADNNFREELILNSKKQSSRFSWEESAKKSIMAISKMISHFTDSNTIYDWTILDEKNKKNFEILMQKLSKNKNLRKYIRTRKVLRETSASIDKVLIQSESLIKTYSKNKNITSWKIEGPFDSNYSLAILNRAFATSLTKNIDKVSIHITEGYGDYEPNIEYLSQFPSLYSIYLNSNSTFSKSEVISRNLYPPRVSDLSAKFNLLHAYGWEESEIPLKWVKNFNTFLDGMTVMSYQVKKILIDNGVIIPIKVTSLGLDHFDSIKIDNSFNIKAKKYRILHISSCFPRKGIDILLKSYGRVFTCDDDVSLIIKTFDNPHNNLEYLLTEEKKLNPKFPHVVVLKEDLNPEQLKSLYLDSHVLVAPSRGEGFGLPIAEAMKLGIPVITTNWGGQLDFCNENNSWLIDYKFKKAESHFNLDNSFWAEPSCTDLEKLLKVVYSSPQSEIQRRVNLAKEQINLLTWDNLAKENKLFVEDKLNTFCNKFSKIGILTTWFSRCGIASYSKHLLEHSIHDVEIFAPLDEKNNQVTSPNVYFSWPRDSQDYSSFETLFNIIKSKKITTLIIQFNYGFYDFKCFSIFLRMLVSDGISVVLILHSTQDPPSNQDKSLTLLVDIFSKCSRLLVHSINDLNRLKDLGLTNNVSLLPHGIVTRNNPSTKSSRKLSSLFSSKSGTKSIASYGFCLPNKGYKELIKSVYFLRQRRMDINLSIYSAIYSKEYEWVYEEIVDLIKELSLQDYVSVDSRFSEESVILDNLTKHDVIVFPYQSSNESSSAAVRFGLSAHKPVLVTPLSIFDDVNNLVDYLPGFNSREIAKYLYDWFEKNDNYSLSEERIKIIKDRSFFNVSNRLFSLINSIERDQFI